jgi:hypothetical protein
VKLLVEGDEAASVLERHVFRMRGLIYPFLHEHQPIGIIGAGEEVMGNATGSARVATGAAGARARRDSRVPGWSLMVSELDLLIG